MSRYGISEWYGQPFLGLSSERRRELAQIALGEAPVPACPFRPMPCNKKGGVCSIRAYTGADGLILGGGESVIVCPVRFEQDRVVLVWLADIVGFDRRTVQMAREVPFMRSTDTGKHAGKIDLVVASDATALRWFGLEFQAVYFSGDGMHGEFVALRDHAGAAPYPVGNRRPDWRSSGAKRLMPQLQVKGPTLRRWHSKITVAVDRPFFASLGGPSEKPSHDLDSGDVIWMVPELADGHLTRWHWEVLTLEASNDKLLAAETSTRQEFEDALRAKLHPIGGTP